MNPRRILIAEPDNEMAMQQAAILQEEQFAVLLAATGDLVAEIERLRPDLLLLRHEREGQSGFALISRIRRQPAIKHTRIVLTTSEATPDAIEKHKSQPQAADAYLFLPLARQDLIGTVRRLTENIEPQPTPTDPATGETAPATFGAGDLAALANNVPVPAARSGGSMLGQEDMEFIEGVFSTLQTGEVPVASVTEGIPLPGTPVAVGPGPMAGPDEKLAFLRRELKERERDLRRLSQLWKVKEQEIAATEARVQAKDIEVEGYLLRIRELGRELDDTRAALAAKERELGESIDHLVEERVILEKDLIEVVAGKEKEIHTLKCERRDLVAKADAERRDLVARIYEWEASYRTQAGELETARYFWGLTRNELDGELVDVGRELRLQQSLVADRERRIDHGDRARDLLRTDLAEERDLLVAVIAARDHEIRSLHAYLAEARARAEGQELEDNELLLETEIALREVKRSLEALGRKARLDIQADAAALIERDTEIESLRCHLDQVRRERAELEQLHRAELAAAEELVVELERDIDRATSYLHATQDRALGIEHDLTHEIERLTEAKDELTERLAEQEFRAGELGNALEETRREKDELAARRASEVAERDERIGVLEDKIRELSDMVTERDDQVNDLTLNVAQLEGALRDREQRIGALENEATQRESVINALRGDLDQRNNTIRAHEADIERLRSRIDDREKRVTEQDAELEQRASSIADLEATLAARDTQVAHLQETLAARESTVREQQQTIAEKSQSIIELDQQLGVRNRELSERDEQNNLLGTQLEQTEARLSEVSAAFQQTNSELLQTRATLDENRALGESLTTQLETARAEISRLSERIGHLDGQLGHAQQRIADQEHALSDGESQRQAIEDELARATRHGNELEQLLASTEQQLVVANEQCKAFEANVADREQRLAAAEERISALDQKVAEGENDLERAQGETQALQERYDELRARLEERGNAIREFEEQLAREREARATAEHLTVEREGQVAALQQTQKRAETRITEYESRIGVLTQELTEARESHEEVQRAVAERDNWLEQREHRIGELQKEIKEREQAQTELTERHATLAAQSDEASQKLTAAEQENTNARNAIARLKSAYDEQKSALKALAGERDDLRTKAGDLEQKLNEALGRIETVEMALRVEREATQRGSDELEQATRTISELTQKQQAAETRLGDMSSHRGTLENEIKDLRGKLDRAELDGQELRKRISAEAHARAELEQRAQKATESERQLTAQKKLFGEMEARAKALERDRDEQKAIADQVRAQFKSQAQASEQGLQTELKKREQAVRDTQAKLDTAIAERDQFKKIALKREQNLQTRIKELEAGQANQASSAEHAAQIEKYKAAYNKVVAEKDALRTDATAKLKKAQERLQAMAKVLAEHRLPIPGARPDDQATAVAPRPPVSPPAPKPAAPAGPSPFSAPVNTVPDPTFEPEGGTQVDVSTPPQYGKGR